MCLLYIWYYSDIKNTSEDNWDMISLCCHLFHWVYINNNLLLGCQNPDHTQNQRGIGAGLDSLLTIFRTIGHGWVFYKARITVRKRAISLWVGGHVVEIVTKSMTTWSCWSMKISVYISTDALKRRIIQLKWKQMCLCHKKLSLWRRSELRNDA